MSNLTRKLFNAVTPYHRTFAVINEYQCTDEQNGDLHIAPITLPLLNTATMFLQNGDTFVIDDVELLYKLSYIDYQIIENTGDNDFKREFEQFVNTVKIFVSRYGNFQFEITQKVVYNNNINIFFKIIENQNL